MNWRIRTTSLLLLVGVVIPAAGQDPNEATIRIGVLPTLSRGAKPELAKAIRTPVLNEIESQTGLDCQLEVLLGRNLMLRKLTAGKLHFGFCQGFEFAWMREKEPRLRALMIALPVNRPLKAYVVVAQGSPAQSLCDLAGQSIAIPKGIHATVRLFTERKCRCEGLELPQLASEVTRPDNGENALHDVYEGKVQAAIVDTAAMQCLAERYPARAKRVRTLLESEPFPMSAVVYLEGSVSPVVLKRFQDGMARARSSGPGRQLMSLMHSNGFEPVTAKYEKHIREFLESYPPRPAASEPD